LAANIPMFQRHRNQLAAVRTKENSREIGMDAAYRKELLGTESYAYLGRPSFLLSCPDCREEFAVYLEDASEYAARSWLDRRLQDHRAGRPHPDAVYVPAEGREQPR
jgi:hypothetical protein